VPVVMGGIHATMCMDEVMERVDSVVTGEGEGIWPQVLEHARHGCLKRRYGTKSWSVWTRLSRGKARASGLRCWRTLGTAA
jgi:radical SAM superfamily enzyme YgiQ (UPF0313 family)